MVELDPFLAETPRARARTMNLEIDMLCDVVRVLL